ncbi:hypothetical protein Q0A17_05650 [Citrobacter sp. S2-9]|uniref:Lipoprotein n=1 Tax=Citrobacter enshiensis TaxID=2971264 RepID=A0ABT8PT10_9ENTR|nr:hypothetical protein [Citrobacter enshiensis]MDN8598896.1 hypothetical protein [Citrobacter enshiensis]
MNKVSMLLAIGSLSVLLSGCVIAPPQGHDAYAKNLEQQGCTQVEDANGTCGNNPQHHHKHHHQDKNMITRDGITLPACADIPDASQADNGSRCWY